MSQCLSWMQIFGVGGAELLQIVEEAEWRQQNNAGPWRLDVRGMLLSKLYHSVTQQDQSPQTAAQLLSLCFVMFHHSRWHSQMLFFSSAFSPHNSNFIHFHFFPFPTILSFSSRNCWVNLSFLCLTSLSIHHKHKGWNTKLGSMMHYKTLLPYTSFTLTRPLSHVHTHALVCIWYAGRARLWLRFKL